MSYNNIKPLKIVKTILYKFFQCLRSSGLNNLAQLAKASSKLKLDFESLWFGGFSPFFCKVKERNIVFYIYVIRKCTPRKQAFYCSIKSWQYRYLDSIDGENESHFLYCLGCGLNFKLPSIERVTVGRFSTLLIKPFPALTI